MTGRKTTDCPPAKVPTALRQPRDLSPLGPAWPPGGTSHLFSKKAPGALPFQIFPGSILQIPVEEFFSFFFLRKWKALEPQNKKKSSRAMALSGFGAKPHIGRTAAACRLKCRDF